jgi:hypothetical protein
MREEVTANASERMKAHGYRDGYIRATNIKVTFMMKRKGTEESSLLLKMAKYATAAVLFALVSCGDGSMNGIYNMFGEHPYIFVNSSATGTGDGTSWKNGYTTLQAALDAAQNGQEIWVCAGTYSGTITSGIKVSLYGGFAGNEGSRDERDPASRHTIPQLTINSNVKGVTLDGFYFDGTSSLSAINDAAVTFENCTFINTDPVDCSTGSEIAFNKCIFTANTASSALQCIDAQVTISNCSFAGNGNTGMLGGAIYINGGTCTIRDHSTFTGNSASSGAAIFIIAGSCAIIDSIIDNNNANSSGGGILIAGGAKCFIRRSVVSNNSLNLVASNGGGICNEGTLTIEDSCTISGNRTGTNPGSPGGGVYNTGTLTVSNSTISGNSATGGGGGVWNDSGSLTITDSAISGNGAGATGGGIDVDGGTLTLIRGSITGNSAGTSGPQVYIQVGVNGRITDCNIGGTVRNYSSISGLTF